MPRIQFRYAVRLVAALALLPVLVGCPRTGSHESQAPKNKDDKDVIQGTWIPVSAEPEPKAPNEDLEVIVQSVLQLDSFLGSLPIRKETLKLIIEGDRWSRPDRVPRATKGTFRLHPDKQPKTIVFEQPIDAKASSFTVGVYKLEADRLTLCVNNRPMNLTPPGRFVGGTLQTLIVYERQKP